MPWVWQLSNSVTVQPGFGCFFLGVGFSEQKHIGFNPNNSCATQWFPSLGLFEKQFHRNSILGSFQTALFRFCQVCEN